MLCEFCHKPITGRTRYCNGTCRNRARRMRRGDAKSPHLYKAPIPQPCLMCGAPTVWRYCCDAHRYKYKDLRKQGLAHLLPYRQQQFDSLDYTVALKENR